MAKSTNTANAVLALIFNATTFANIAQNASSSPLANLYLGLHVGDPGVGGAQTTNEATYTGYARLAIPRTTSGFDAPSLGQTANAALAQFAECTGGSNVISHVSVGTDASGTGRTLYVGALTASRTISAGIQPQFAAGALVVQES